MKKIIVISIIFISIFSACGSDEHNSSSTPSLEEPIVIPIQIYQYDFVYKQGLSSHFLENRIISYIAECNEIWEQANITFDIQDIKRVEIKDEVFQDSDIREYDSLEFLSKLNQLSTKYIDINSMSKKGEWTLIFINHFPIDSSGIWSDEIEAVYFSETFQGSNTPYSLMAHHLGHSLSLTHVQSNEYPENLMISGSDGGDIASHITLTNQQIISARTHVSKYKR
jgi:hypothetical protein